VASAQAASLRYVNDTRPGIRRKRAGRHFRYLGPDGRPVRGADDLARIRALAVPPAWTDVWICPSPRGHIQATGRDARGRKQYRYHPRWRAMRDETKYTRMLGFGEALPRLRKTVEQHLGLPHLPREKVLATVVRLLDCTAMRVGNPEYARANNSFGLTTMRNQHAEVSGARVRFQFRGKGGKLHHVDIADRRAARVIRRCQELPGQELFQYVDDEGQTHTIDSDDVNVYLREVTGNDFTAKDFRTWAGTVLASVALQHVEPPRSKRHGRRNLLRAIESVAERLGNTPTVCRKSYIHPAVIGAYLQGSPGSTRIPPDGTAASGGPGLRPEERGVLALLARAVGAPVPQAA
jgi:DNA topoisomerase-1